MINRQIGTNDDKIKSASLNHAIASLLIENPSITDQEISEKIGLCRQSVNTHRNSKEVCKLLKESLSIPVDEVRRISAKALVRLEQMLDHEDPKIRLTATLSLLKLIEKFMTNDAPIEIPRII